MHAQHALTIAPRPAPRDIDPADWHRFEANLAEIFEALGLPPDTPGTRDTPQRFLRALFDATAGYDGDPKLVTAFPAETDGVRSASPGQIVEGPIAFHALCEHHALPFYGVAHVGYLPGDIEEKLNPWMQPIYDNVEFLMGLSKAERKTGRSYQELIDLGYVEIEPLTYIRGRSIPNQFIISQLPGAYA